MVRDCHDTQVEPSDHAGDPVVLLTVTTQTGPQRDRRIVVPWSPLPKPPDESTVGPAVRVTVDGEDFEVRASPGRPGAYHYEWISGPNPGYGFSSARSDAQPSTMEEHEGAIRNFLAQVDPETGYIE